MCLGQRCDFVYSEAVEFAPHRVDVCEGQRVSVGAVGEQDEDAPVAWVDPDAGAGESVVAEAVRRQVRAG